MKEKCHLYDRDICDVSEAECTKCQLEHLWNRYMSLIVNEINCSCTGCGAFGYTVKGNLTAARKETVKHKIEMLKLIELQSENLNIEKGDKIHEILL